MKTLRFLRFLCIVVFACWMTACGGWAQNARASLLSANQALNGYDDVAAELWSDAHTNDTSFDRLEKSLCIWLTAQDALVEAWATVTMVQAGVEGMSRADLGMWVGQVMSLLDALEDQLETWEVPIPAMIGKAFDALKAFAPGSVATIDPPDGLQCKAILAKHGSK